MTRDNELKIQLKTGLSFCWLDKDFANQLNKLVKNSSCISRAEYIQEAALNILGIWPETKEDLSILDKRLKPNGYKNRVDWLRDIIREGMSSLNTETVYCFTGNLLFRGHIITVMDQAKSYTATLEMSKNKIKRIIDDLYEIIPENIRTTNEDVNIESYILLSKSRHCYRQCLELLMLQKFGQALHELYDFVYQYGGAGLKKQISVGEHVMLHELVNLFRVGLR